MARLGRASTRAFAASRETHRKKLLFFRLLFAPFHRNYSETGWAGATTSEFFPTPLHRGDGLALKNDFLFFDRAFGKFNPQKGLRYGCAERLAPGGQKRKPAILPSRPKESIWTAMNLPELPWILYH